MLFYHFQSVDFHIMAPKRKKMNKNRTSTLRLLGHTMASALRNNTDIGQPTVRIEEAVSRSGIVPLA
jgi:hypothetical protein